MWCWWSGNAFIESFLTLRLCFQVPREILRQRGSSSSKCLWTWTPTATRSSTPTSPVPRTLRTSASCLQLSKTPSYSSISKSTTWCEGPVRCTPPPHCTNTPLFGNVLSTPHALHGTPLQLTPTHTHSNITIASFDLIFSPSEVHRSSLSPLMWACSLLLLLHRNVFTPPLRQLRVSASSASKLRSDLALTFGIIVTWKGFGFYKNSFFLCVCAYLGQHWLARSKSKPLPT